MNDIAEWTGISNITAGEMWDYLTFRYASIVIPNYTVERWAALAAIWHDSHKYKYSHMAQTLTAEYNPISNYNRTTVGERTRTPDIEKTREYNDEMAQGGTDETTTGNEITGTVSPYDASTFANREKSESAGGGSVTYGRTDTHTGTVTDSESGTDSEEYTETVSGNIGVTTTQEMIEQERRISDFVILDIYLADFIKNFSIGIFCCADAMEI